MIEKGNTLKRGLSSPDWKVEALEDSSISLFLDGQKSIKVSSSRYLSPLNCRTAMPPKKNVFDQGRTQATPKKENTRDDDDDNYLQ